MTNTIELKEYTQKRSTPHQDKAAEPDPYVEEPTDGTVSAWAWGTACMFVHWFLEIVLLQ